MANPNPSKSGQFKPGYDPRRYVAKSLKDRKSLTDLCKMHTEAAVKAIVSIMHDKESKPSDVLKAANSLLDRAYGTPANTVQMQLVNADSGGDVTSLSNEELRYLLAKKLMEAPPGGLEMESKDIDTDPQKNLSDSENTPPLLLEHPQDRAE